MGVSVSVLRAVCGGVTDFRFCVSACCVRCVML